MTEISLTGLRGNHPLKAMAAFGLLRVLADRTDLEAPRLSWDPSSNLARLHFPNDCDRDQLLDALVDSMRGRDQAAHFTESDDIKMSPQEYMDFCVRVIEKTDDSQKAEAQSFLAAFASELVTDRAGKNVKPTPFHMTAGQQRFLKSCRELAESLNPDRELTKKEAKKLGRDDVYQEIRSAFERALFGPWIYQDEFHSLGFDPATEALHALSDRAPTKVKPTSECAAVWLGFEALPLFPCLPQVTRRGQLVLQTRGFEPGRSTPNWFRWPLWSPPVSEKTLQSLLGAASILRRESQDPEELKRRQDQFRAQGVFAIYQSDCIRDANGRGTFRHARPVHLES